MSVDGGRPRGDGEGDRPTRGELVRAARVRQEITQAQLALRADVSDAVIEQVERDELVPDDVLLERLLLVMGEESVREADVLVGSRRMTGDWDPVRMAEELRKTPSERLEDALAWNQEADEIYLAFKRERERRP